MNFKRLAQTTILSCCCLFSLLSCTSSNSLQKSNEEFLKTNAPTLLPWSEQVNSSPLTVTDSMTLEEFDYFVISGVRDWDIDFDNNKFAITEVRSGGILLYDLNNGTLLKGKVPGYDLTDSVVTAFPYKHSIVSTYHNIKQLLTYEDASLLLNKPVKQLQSFKNSFEIPRFVKGKLYTVLLTYLPGITNEGKSIMINLTTMMQLDDKMRIVNMTHFDISDGFFVLPFNFIYDKKSNSFWFSNEGAIIQDKFNNEIKNPIVISFAETGKLSRIIYQQRKELNSKFLYNDFQFTIPIMGDIEHNVYLTTAYDNRIYCPQDSLIIQLSNLPYNWESSYSLYDDILKLINDENKSKKDSINSFLKFFPIRIQDIIDINGNIGVVMKYWYSFKRDEFKYIIQEYSKTGELLSQNIYIPENGKKTSQFSFDNKTNQLITLSFVNEKWQLERRAWRKAK